MSAQKRRFAPAVIDRLFSEPYRFEFFQAVRMLDLWLKRRGQPRRGRMADFLRFQNSLSLAFPASQLEALHTEPRDIAPHGVALGSALEAGTLCYVRITPSFMGLLGNQGVLPAHYTERIADHLHQDKDEGARSFLDTFSNRSLVLFYEAWRKYRLPLRYQHDGDDGFLPLLLALAGLGDASLRRRLADPGQGAVLDESIGYFAASLRQRPASATQLGRVLGEYFAHPVRVEQFVGDWYEVPLSQQTMLGADTALLGSRAIAGSRVWQRDLRLRLAIGPLDASSFNAFLPGGLAARALASLVTMFTGVTLAYEVELELRAQDVRSTTLGEQGHAGRLGWDAFLVERPSSENRKDVRYPIHAF